MRVFQRIKAGVTRQFLYRIWWVDSPMSQFAQFLEVCNWPIVADQEPRISGFSVSGERQLLAELRSTVTNHMSMVSVWRMSVVVPNSDEGTDSVLMGTSAIARDITAQVQLL